MSPSGTEGPTPDGRTPDAAPARAAPGPGVVLGASLAMVLCVGVADHLTGVDVVLILFYLAPVGFGTWLGGLRTGLVVSAVGVVVAMTADALHRAGVDAPDLALPVLAWNGLMQAGASVALALLLASLRARLEAEERLARTDPLTRIWNRRAFFEAAALELERARRHGRALTAVYVDCDDFKDVNDLRGHAEGDALLVAAARTLRAETRAVDAVARLGGDEFGLLLPETGAADAEALLRRVQEALLAAMASNGWRVGFTIGAATFLAPPASVDDLMARADELMFAAKRERKGSIRLRVFSGVARPPRGGVVTP